MPIGLKLISLVALYLGLFGSLLLAVEAIGLNRIGATGRALGWLLGSKYETPRALLLLFGLFLTVATAYWTVPPEFRHNWHPGTWNALVGIKHMWPFSMLLVFLPLVTVIGLRSVVRAALHAQDKGFAGVVGFGLLAGSFALQAVGTVLS